MICGAGVVGGGSPHTSTTVTMRCAGRQRPDGVPSQRHERGRFLARPPLSDNRPAGTSRRGRTSARKSSSLSAAAAAAACPLPYTVLDRLRQSPTAASPVSLPESGLTVLPAARGVVVAAAAAVPARGVVASAGPSRSELDGIFPFSPPVQVAWALAAAPCCGVAVRVAAGKSRPLALFRAGCHVNGVGIIVSK
jgi:hypothetical protein